MKNLIICLAGFLPFISVLLFANPNEGLFSKSIGCLAMLLLTGCVNWYYQEKIKDEQGNGIKSMSLFGLILVIGITLSTLL